MVITALTAGSAAAQNLNAEPNYGTIRLHGIDPHVVHLQSGGTIEAGRLGDGCAGYVSNAPDVRLNFTGGRPLPLTFSAISDADTMLVVNAPDGRWYCNDDANAGTHNPSIRFASPLTGRYEIWVGTRAGPESHSARLEISELTDAH